MSFVYVGDNVLELKHQLLSPSFLGLLLCGNLACELLRLVFEYLIDEIIVPDQQEANQPSTNK